MYIYIYIAYAYHLQNCREMCETIILNKPLKKREPPQNYLSNRTSMAKPNITIFLCRKFSNSLKKEQIFGNDFDDMDNMNIGNNNDIFNNEDGDEQIARTSDKSLLWHMEVMNDVGNENSIEFINNDDFNNNEMFSKPCRNSVQDKFLIVDENGYLCTRYELSNGCCNKNILEQTTIISNLVSLRKNRYTCKTCNPQGCCTIYEYCVSCCLHPKKIKKIEYLNKYQIQRKNFKLRHGEDILKLRLRSLDRFQLCLAACRTSSASVHENTYNNPFYKYCYILQLSRNHFKQTKET